MPQSSTARERVKKAVRARDGMRCTMCGKTNEQHVAAHGCVLEVHRTTPGSLYTIEGCVTVCRDCHHTLPRRKPGAPDLAYPTYPGRRTYRLPADLLGQLQKLAAKTRRRPAVEVELALVEHLKRAKRIAA